MVFTKSYVFPILFGCWLPLTIITTYTLSVIGDHVTPILPYISDTGSWPPESCIFGIMLTIEAYLMLTVVYIRYRQVQDLQEKYEFSVFLKRCNDYSMIIGIISTFGGLIVATFQVKNLFYVHIVGAGICFGFGTLYQILQVAISFMVHPMIGKYLLNIFRLFFTTISALSLAVTTVCGIIAFIQFKGDNMGKWKQEDGGYELHFISAVAEYVLAGSTIFNIVSFVEEFRSVEVQSPVVTTRVGKE